MQTEMGEGMNHENDMKADEIVKALTLLTTHGLLRWNEQPGGDTRIAAGSLGIMMVEMANGETMLDEHGRALVNPINCSNHDLVKLVFKPKGFCKDCLRVVGGSAKYFGVCPQCHQTDGMLNIGCSHWYYCRAHKTRWNIGANLLSGWKQQTEEEQKKIYDDLGFDSFEDVKPHHCV